MRIKHVFIVVLLVATLLPPSLFGIWAYRDGIRSEFEDVSDQHLLIAKNLGDALSRYRQDIDAISGSVATALTQWRTYPDIDQTLAALDIDYIAIVNREHNELVAKVTRAGVKLEQVPPFLIKLTNDLPFSQGSENIRFTEVMEGPSPESGNVMYGYRNYGPNVAVTRISTDYFVSLGKSISFGLKGHAAIVDHMGNVLSHPLDSWIDQRKNIAAVSAVARMMAGETGVEQFYSPALKGDMIAGFTSVPGSDWGVMIPQPIEELYAKVWDNNRALLVTMALAVTLTFAALLIVLYVIGKPITAFTRALNESASDGQLKPINLSGDHFLLREFGEFEKAYNHLHAQVDSANSEIRKLAFTDSVTKLPNRARFQSLVEQALKDPSQLNRGGSLVFIDIDNFKMVNDVHGHDVGDFLLKSISQKLADRVQSQWLSGNQALIGSDTKPCVSRIGGDEFAIFMPGLTGKHVFPVSAYGSN